MIGRAALPYTPHVESRIPPLRAGDPIFVNSWGHPLTYKNLYNRIKKIGRIAEIENIKPHRLRHSCATIFLNSKGSAVNLQSHLGHKDFRTTKIYAKSLKTAYSKMLRPHKKQLIEEEVPHHFTLWYLEVTKTWWSCLYKMAPM